MADIVTDLASRSGLSPDIAKKAMGGSSVSSKTKSRRRLLPRSRMPSPAPTA